MKHKNFNERCIRFIFHEKFEKCISWSHALTLETKYFFFSTSSEGTYAGCCLDNKKLIWPNFPSKLCKRMAKEIVKNGC